jgi:hypothetical protein
MSVEDIIAKRGIHEILHFTTNKGVTGILATGALKARSLLSEDDYLVNIYEYNCPERLRDKDWWGYVNLSISSVNRKLFGISSGKWHANEDGWWCILSFSPEICCHEGVYFTTTNNMYSGVKRCLGERGLEAMFSSRIIQWDSSIVIRQPRTSDNQPTCPQAEVLYPREVQLKYLSKIYIKNDENAARLESIMKVLPNCETVPCEVNPSLFFEQE